MAFKGWKNCTSKNASGYASFIRTFHDYRVSLRKQSIYQSQVMHTEALLTYVPMEVLYVMIIVILMLRVVAEASLTTMSVWTPYPFFFASGQDGGAKMLLVVGNFERVCCSIQ